MSSFRANEPGGGAGPEPRDEQYPAPASYSTPTQRLVEHTRQRVRVTGSGSELVDSLIHAIALARDLLDAEHDALDVPSRVERQKEIAIQAMSLVPVMIEAARWAGVHYSTLKAWERKDPAFSAALEAAKEIAVDVAEAVLWQRAHQSGRKGSDRLLMRILAAERPAKWDYNAPKQGDKVRESDLPDAIQSVLKRMYPDKSVEPDE